MIYSKSAKTIDEQITKLLERGMIIQDVPAAKLKLAHISYYRLAGYWWPMYVKEKESHIFKAGSRFEDAIALYDFDHELRAFLFEQIGVIEISLRTKLIYHLSHECGPWWFQDSHLFINSKSLIKTLHTVMEEVDRAKDQFMKVHKRKYKEDQRFPPSWKTLELTSFGGLSKLYGNLKPSIQAKDLIATELGAVNHTYLKTWLQSLTQIRNYCAHHSRLWNKNLPGTPKLLSKPPFSWIEDIPKRHEFPKLYIHLCLIKYLISRIAPSNDLTQRISSLLAKYPNVDPNALGFKPDWQGERLWAD